MGNQTETRNQIPTGRENAIPLERLCEVWHTTPRRARQKIAALRATGELILSSTESKGYYYPDSAEEIRRFVKSMSNRARHCFRSCSAARAELRRLEREAEDD